MSTARWIYVGLMLLCAILFFVRPPQMKTDLFDLLGAAGSPVEEALAAISRADASRLRVLVEADDFETAKRAA